MYVRWDNCYTDGCLTHVDEKVKNQKFPAGDTPVYYQWNEVYRWLRQRKLEGQLQLDERFKDVTLLDGQIIIATGDSKN